MFLFSVLFVVCFYGVCAHLAEAHNILVAQILEECDLAQRCHRYALIVRVQPHTLHRDHSFISSQGVGNGRWRRNLRVEGAEDDAVRSLADFV